MRGTRKDWGYKWAVVPGLMSRDEVDLIRRMTVNQPHFCDDVNNVGTAWEWPLTQSVLDVVLTPTRLRRLAAALDEPAEKLLRLVPRFWHSVVRTNSTVLPVHNDVLPADPARTYAVIFYLNDYWHESWGGAVNLHKGVDGLRVPFYPVEGACTIIEVNKHSWHSVDTPVGSAHRHALVGWLDDPAKPCDLEGSTVRLGLKNPTFVPGDVVFNRHLRE